MAETTPADHDPRWRLTPTKIIVTVLLLIGIIVPLLLWVFLAAGICWTSFVLLQRESKAYRRDHPQSNDEAVQ